jgi:anti-sigma B factor antagonist
MQSIKSQNSTGDGAFSISSRRLERGILVALSGDVDLATATVVDDELRRAEQSEDLVVLDLGQVTFMDSTGLRMVISADQRLRERGASLKIQHVPPQVSRLFELVGVSEYLGIAVSAEGQSAASDGTPVSPG